MKDLTYAQQLEITAAMVRYLKDCGSWSSEEKKCVNNCGESSDFQEWYEYCPFCGEGLVETDEQIYDAFCKGMVVYEKIPTPKPRKKAVRKKSPAKKK